LRLVSAFADPARSTAIGMVTSLSRSCGWG
jgi:hypothetical protein